MSSAGIIALVAPHNIPSYLAIPVHRAGESISRGTELALPGFGLGTLCVATYSKPSQREPAGSMVLGFNDDTRLAHAKALIPRAIAYSTGLLNYFFRGRLLTRYFDKGNGTGEVEIVNDSGESLGDGQFFIQEYNDDPADFRINEIARMANQSTVQNGARVRIPIPKTPEGTEVRVVFVGTIGNEQDISVALGRTKLCLPPPSIAPVPNMVWIPCGSAILGSPPDSPCKFFGDEYQDPYPVTIVSGYWIGKYEVTQNEYLSLMNTNPSYFNGKQNFLTVEAYCCDPEFRQNYCDHCDFTDGCNCFVSFWRDYGVNLQRPVERVSYADATAYCISLTQRERDAGRLPVGYEYRLPSGVEWEYACRAGTTTSYSFGASLLPTMANVDFSFRFPTLVYKDDDTFTIKEELWSGPAPVGSYPPNPWGLYDMHGNVSEWTRDPTWWISAVCPETTTELRGGGFQHSECYSTSSARVNDAPQTCFQTESLGFRIVLSQVR